MAEYRLPEQKYTEVEYLFQTIEMAKSDEEFDVELCSSPPSSMDQLPANSSFSWKEMPARRARWQGRCIWRPPPAPPSTPTSLTASNTPAPSPTAAASLSAIGADDERLGHLLYILDYAPKYKKKLKEQQRTDGELADLLNVFTITGGVGAGESGGGGGGATKLLPERGISSASRVIRRNDTTTKIFKIHRNPKEFFRDPDEEDSVSAPEYDNEEERGMAESRLRRFSRRTMLSKRQQRRFARFEHQERMDAMLDTFDAAMNFNGA